jgi:DNA mismatch repair protein MutL
VARFVDVDAVQGPVHVVGLAERPSDVGTATRRVLLIVNGRVVRDLGLVRAAEAAYKSTIPAGVRPSLVLQIHLPGADVDVNVHPAKSEVRLRDRWPVERAVEHAVRRALGLLDASAGLADWRSWRPAAAPMTAAAQWNDAARPVEPSALRRFPAAEGLFAAVGAAPADAPPHMGPSVLPSEAEAEAIPVPALMQLRRTYLMFEHEDGVVLIDQHSAHERILYERFLGAIARGDAPSQRLLFPLTLHLSAQEANAFEEHRALFAQLGYDAEPFGGHSVLVHAVPAPHPRFDAERCLRDTLAALTGDRAPSVAGRHEHLAATVACKAAIKAGDALSAGEMRALFLALADTQLPAHDVHGRSTIVRLSWDELDRRFGRR